MVKRRLVFYRWKSVPSKPEFVPSACLTDLAARMDADPDRSVLHKDDVTTAVTIPSAGSMTSPGRVQLLALRSPANRPSQWQPGEKIGALPLLDDQYPADVTHVAIWPDGIVCQDLHANAPRLGRLSYYLRHQANSYVSFEPLYHPDMIERLKRLRGRLRRVELSMSRPEYVETDGGVFATLLPRVFGQSVPSISVNLGMGRRGRRDRFLDSTVEEAVFRIAEDSHDIIDRLVVAGYDPQTQRTERVNLLGERLQVQLDLPASADVPALPDEDRVFLEMSNAFAQLQAEGLIERAIQAQVTRGSRWES